MRVLHVVHQYAPAIGGSETLVRRIAEGVAAAGDASFVLTSTSRRVTDFLRPSGDGLPAGAFRLGGVDVRRLEFRRVPAFARSAVDRVASAWWQRRWPGYGAVKSLWIGPHLRGLRREIRRARPDLVVAATTPFRPFFEAARAAWAGGVPVALLPCLHPGDRWLLDNPALWDALRRADAVLALTTHEARLVTSLGVEADRVHVLGGGVDEAPPATITDVRSRFGLPPDEPIVLFLGRKEEAKGIRPVVEATRLLRSRGRAARLVLAGARTAYSRYVLDPWLASLPAGERARILVRDDVDEAEKWGWLSACALLAHPSAVESFGLVYLEAWLMGKPVIGGRDGPTASLVRHEVDGLLVGHGDVGEIAGAIERLLADPERARQLGASGREAVRRNHTWPRVVDRARAFHHSAVARHHAERPAQRGRRHPR